MTEISEFRLCVPVDLTRRFKGLSVDAGQTAFVYTAMWSIKCCALVYVFKAANFFFVINIILILYNSNYSIV